MADKAVRCGNSLTRRRRLARDVRKHLGIYVNSLEPYIDNPESAELALIRAINTLVQLSKLHEQSKDGPDVAR